MNYYEGKAIVYGYLNDRQVVLKTKHTDLTDRERLGFVSSEQKKVSLPDPTEFINMVRFTVQSAFGLEPVTGNEKLIAKLWHADTTHPMQLFLKTYEKNSENSLLQEAAMKSLWSLLQQDEYLFLQYFSDNQFLPNIHGSCGHVYAMEYAPSTGVLESTIFQWSGVHAFTWAERADIARRLLDLVKSMEADYHEALYMCDVKGGNFGIANNGVVKPIDVDTVFFHSKLVQTFKDTTCSVNKDCDFFDCLGVCDKQKGRCTDSVLNNNLQVT